MQKETKYNKLIETYINHFRISKNFLLSEFQSHDTKEVKIYPELIVRLELLRERIKKPIIITSGYRTPEQNTKVGGHPRSKHMEGKAADIIVKGVKLDKIHDHSWKVGFKKVIMYEKKNFLHVNI